MADDVSTAGMATVHVRCSNGTKFSVKANLASSVSAFKTLLFEGSGVAADQQRLIYKGRVLKDESTLESYGVENDHTIHLVRAAPTSSAVAAATGASTNSSVTPPTGITPSASPANMFGGINGFGGAADVFGLGNIAGGLDMGFPEFQQVQQQLMQNPNLMREMMNMPAVQSLMNNPEIMRNMIMNNPQMRSLIDRNPELGHILNDPSTLRQTLDAARNPELMREMMRNTDRAMSNIEASPEGFNMLRRMYETVEEPFLNAATGVHVGNDVGANPFAALLGTHGQGGANAPAPVAEAAAPNTAPLPNPWNPTQNAGTARTWGEAGQPPYAPTPGLDGLGGLGSLGGLGFPDFGAADGMGLMDPSMVQQLLQNPALRQMMQGLLSNPQYINQILNTQPHLRAAMNANPQFRDMMTNPDFLRQISSPEVLQQMLSLQSAGQLQTPAAQTPTGNGASVRPYDMNSLLSLLGALGGGPGPAFPEVNTGPPEQVYAAQLSQLQDMGFIDVEANIQALRSTGGNVHAAVDRLLGNPG